MTANSTDSIPVNADAVDEAIRKRRTIKVLSPQPLPHRDCLAQVNELVSIAGWAPFHRACDAVHRDGSTLDGIEPWRFHILDSAACRKLRPLLPELISGKIPAMLAAADALIIVTWLPNPPAAATSERTIDARQAVPEFVADYPPAFESNLSNMEHLAAASAAVQNLLIAATARGIDNYWSSGGVLRSPAAFDLLGIPQTQILLAAIFLFPASTEGEGDGTGHGGPNEHDTVERVGSKLREHRTTPNRWSRIVASPESGSSS